MNRRGRLPTKTLHAYIEQEISKETQNSNKHIRSFIPSKFTAHLRRKKPIAKSLLSLPEAVKSNEVYLPTTTHLWFNYQPYPNN